jgi:hypothetical protein
MYSHLKIPVAFFIFNRPDVTLKVFERIREVKPQKLFIIADGARFPEEEHKCQEARSIIQKIDWECEVLTNFSDINLGCKIRVSSGLDWVFSQAEEAIILEDDCLPDPTFFQFCSELLEHYRNDQRVMMISGDNFQFGKKRTNDSYYFSIFPHCWGWATWRRAWQHYDIDMKLWLTARDGCWLMDILHSKSAVIYWESIFQDVFNNLIDTWDYQWTFACWMQSGLTILPNVNLVSNIGFNNEATHTKKTKNYLANMGVESMILPLAHPKFIVCNSQFDNLTQKNIFSLSILKFIKIRVKNILVQLQNKI